MNWLSTLRLALSTLGAGHCALIAIVFTALTLTLVAEAKPTFAQRSGQSSEMIIMQKVAKLTIAKMGETK